MATLRQGGAKRKARTRATGPMVLYFTQRYGMCYGMAIMIYRSTFALDEPTVKRIKELATLWQVSQAEVVRRVVASTETAVPPDPVALLHELHRAGAGLTAAAAKTYMTEVRAARKTWRPR